MPFGFPFLTKNTIVEMYGDELFSNLFCQSFENKPAFWLITSTS